MNDLELYGTPPNAAEFKIARLIASGIPAHAAELFAALDKPRAPRVKQFKARIEYAGLPKVIKLENGIPCDGWHDECRAKSPLSAGVWVGD